MRIEQPKQRTVKLGSLKLGDVFNCETNNPNNPLMIIDWSILDPNKIAVVSLRDGGLGMFSRGLMVIPLPDAYLQLPEVTS